MITKEQLSSMIESWHRIDKYLDELDSFGIDVLESPLFEEYGRAFDLVISTNFDEGATDIFNAWLYEGLTEFVENGNDVPIDNFDELWDYLSKHFI